MDHTHHGSCCHDHSDDEQKEGHSCGGCHCGHHQTEIEITEEEMVFLTQLAQTPYLPLARFVLRSTKSSHLASVALAPVYLDQKTDMMEMVKSKGAVLESLAHKGVITLDYDEPLENGDYTAYSASELYAYFTETVAEGKAKGKDDFLFDTPSLELGSIALTDVGRQVIQLLDKAIDPQD